MWAPRRRWWTLALIAVLFLATAGLATAGLAAAEHWLYPGKDQDIRAVLAGFDSSHGHRLAPVEDVTAAVCRSGRCRQAVQAGDVLVVRFATRELAADAADREAAAGRDAYRSEWVVVSSPAGTPASEIALLRQVFPESEKISPAA
jgi:hypothetical protein